MSIHLPGLSFRPFLPEAVALSILMLLTAATEGVGLILLVPLLGLLSGESGSMANNGFLHGFWQAVSVTGLPKTTPALLLAFVLLICCRSLILFARDRANTTLQQSVVDALRMACFTALLRVEWRWLIRSRKSDQANLLLTDVSRVGIGIQFGLGLLVTVITVLVYLVTACVLSWQLTLITLLCGGILFTVMASQRRSALTMGHTMGEANRALLANVQEALAGMKLTKILGNEQRHLSHFHETVQAVRQQQIAFMSSSSLSRALFQTGGAALLAGFLFLGLSYWQTPLPELLTLVLIFSRLIPLLMSGQQQYHHCLHALPAFKETQKLLKECQQAAEPLAKSTASWPVTVEITLRGITVRYAGREDPALDQVSLSLPVRTTTAIMGPSGAGKSTFADVLMGLLMPDNGEMRIDGVPIIGEARMRWRHSVAYVPQEVFLFHDTIRQNLLWGNPEATEPDLCHALQLAAADFVLKLPQSLDTVVGDGGVRLSGGERQRIALARALLKRPSLLILDEATSALDRENEAHIRDAIENLHGDLTVVIIGHRLPTLEHADQVVIINSGRIAQAGSWEAINAVATNQITQ